MKKNRSRLLILLALLTIGLTPMPRASYGMQALVEPSQGTFSTSTTGPLSGDPDTPNSRSTASQHSASQISSSEPGSGGYVVVPHAVWLSTVIRIWAALHLGVGVGQ